MAGRVVNEEQHAIFRPYPNAGDAQISEAGNAVSEDVIKFKPPIVEDKGNTSGSTHATSKKKKKKKKPKKKSSVRYQFLFAIGDWLTQAPLRRSVLYPDDGTKKFKAIPFHRVACSTLSLYKVFFQPPLIRRISVHILQFGGMPQLGGICWCSCSTKAE